MNLKFENFAISSFDNLDKDNPFMVGIKDRICFDDERWAITSLSIEEAKQIYEELRKYFND